MIIEQNDVELLSIQMKTPQHIDNEINANAQKNTHPLLNRHSSKITNECDHHNDDVDDNDADDHYESAVRLLCIEKTANGACGFHLTRSKWDPYPWVSAVDSFTPAKKCGLKTGDCVLEVNGCDVLGLRIAEIAKLVKSSQHQVTLLLWSPKCNSDCNEESLCAAPMPRSLQRLSAVVQCVLSILECPVCLDTITPPAMQCQNGHLLCVNCRIRAENCPVCRDRYYPRPALIAEQLQAAITSAFNLCRNEDKVRQRIFGRHNRQRQMVKTTLEYGWRGQVHKSKAATTTSTIALPDNGTEQQKPAPAMVKNGGGGDDGDGKHHADMAQKRYKTTTRACNKLLTKLLNFKTYSIENRTNTNTMAANASAISKTQSASTTMPTVPSVATIEPGMDEEHRRSMEATALTHQLNTNQLNDSNATNVVRPKQLSMTMTTAIHQPIVENDLNINSNPDCCKQMFNNRIKHFSLSSSDLTKDPAATTTTTATTRMKALSATNVRCLLESSSLPANVIPNSSSPIVFPRRPCPKNDGSLLQTIPRALKLSIPYTIEIETPSSCRNCHQGDDNDGDGDDDDATLSITSNNSTPSTISLKSLCSSSTSCLDLTSNLRSSLP